jgi:hypothetical protein
LSVLKNVEVMNLRIKEVKRTKIYRITKIFEEEWQLQRFEEWRG